MKTKLAIALSMLLIAIGCDNSSHNGEPTEQAAEQSSERSTEKLVPPTNDLSTALSGNRVQFKIAGSRYIGDELLWLDFHANGILHRGTKNRGPFPGSAKWIADGNKVTIQTLEDESYIVFSDPTLAVGSIVTILNPADQSRPEGMKGTIAHLKPIPPSLGALGDSEPSTSVTDKLITDIIVLKEIRKTLKKPEGVITKADLETVTELNLALAGIEITDAILKDVAKCKQLKLLNCNAGQITAEGLREIAKLQKLETLGLSGTGVTDAGLKEVAKCTQLTFLNLLNTKITDAGLKEVGKLKKLNDLTLGYNEITGTGLKELAKLNQLRTLWLDGTKVTKADVAEFKKALPNCNVSGP